MGIKTVSCIVPLLLLQLLPLCLYLELLHGIPSTNSVPGIVRQMKFFLLKLPLVIVFISAIERKSGHKYVSKTTLATHCINLLHNHEHSLDAALTIVLLLLWIFRDGLLKYSQNRKHKVENSHSFLLLSIVCGPTWACILAEESNLNELWIDFH